MYENLHPLEEIANLAADGRSYDGDHHKNFFFIEILKRLKELESKHKELKKMKWTFDDEGEGEKVTLGIQIDEWRGLFGWDADNEIPP